MILWFAKDNKKLSDKITNYIFCCCSEVKTHISHYKPNKESPL